MHPIDVGPVDRLVVQLVYWQTRRGSLRAKVARLILKLSGVDWRPHSVGPGLRMPHATTGSVMHSKAVLGRDVTVMQGVTVGRSDSWVKPGADEGVTIEDGAVLGANAVVLFRGGRRLTVGAGSVVGAGAVLTESTGAGEVWAGNPARRVSVR